MFYLLLSLLSTNGGTILLSILLVQMNLYKLSNYHYINPSKRAYDNFTYEARYGAEYRFFELLVNMVNAENVVNMVNIIEAGEEKMICVRDI